MKRLVSFLIVVLAMFSLFAGQTNRRLDTMGGIGIAAKGGAFSFFRNPASLFFNEGGSRLLFEGELGDSFSTSGEEFIPANPVTHLNGMVSGGMISCRISLDYTVDKDRRMGDVWNCNAYQTSEINLQLAAGYGGFGAGIGILGGSKSQRISIEVDPQKAISDYITECFFGPYDRVSNSEFLQINVGMMYSFGSLCAGVIFDNVLDKTGNKTSVSMDSFFSETGIGVFYTRPEYNNLGHLNLWGYSIGADISKLLAPEERTLHLGGELTYRLMGSYSISILAGYNSVLRTIGDGVLSVGGSADIGVIRLTLGLDFPTNGQTWGAGVSGALMI